MAKRYKLIALDLDGTLLNNEGKLSEYNCNVLKAAKDKGAIICMVSGRPYYDIYPFCREIGISHPVAYSNGSCVYDPVSGEHWLNNFLPVEDTMHFIRYCEKIGCDWSITAYNCHIVPANVKRYIWSEDGYRNTKGLYESLGIEPPANYYMYPEEVYEKLKEGVSEISVEYYPDDDSVKELVDLVDKYFAETPTKLNSKKVADNMRDITYCECDKWLAIKVIAEKLGIPLDEVCVFGDNMNDFTMIKECETSFAMGNGDERLFDHATYIAEDNDCDGVGKAIEKYILDYIG